MDDSETEPKWVKFGNVHSLEFIGRDVVACSWGIYVKFYHLNTKEERLERFSSGHRGEGVACLAGHRVAPVFAIAERCPRPRILTWTYPNLKRVSACVRERCPTGGDYLSVVFVGTEYLVTLSSFPDFQITVWLWRTGEKLATRNTDITDCLQQITCSVTSPHIISQLSLTSGRLMFYEISVCSKIVSLLPVEVKPFTNRKVSVSWTAEGWALVCDNVGNVVSMSADGKKRHTIIRSGSVRMGKCPAIAAFQGGLILVDSASQIKFYRRPLGEHSPGEALWESLWEIRAVSHPVRLAVHPQREEILFYGEQGEFFVVVAGEEDVPQLEVKHRHGVGFQAIALVYPGARRLAAIDKFGQLTVFEPTVGQSMGSLSLIDHGEVFYMVPHPDIPVIAVTTNTGKCVLVSMYQETKPHIITSFHLHRETLDRVKYSYDGKILGVGNSSTGDFFFIGGEPGGQMYVISNLRTRKQIVDFLLYHHDGSLKLLVLFVTSTRAVVGDRVMVFTLGSGETVFQKEDYTIELLNTFGSLHYGPMNTLNVIGAPYLSKQLHLLEIQDNFEAISVIEAIPSGHQLRRVQIYTDRHHLITTSYDGLVIVRDGGTFEKAVAAFMAHHRQEGGSMFAVVSPICDTVFSLGKNGTLVATKLNIRASSPQFERPAKLSLDPSDVQRMFSSPTQGFVSSEEDCTKTWVECQEAHEIRREHNVSAAARASIMEDFRKLRTQLADLLDANEKAPVEESLPIAVFNLDEKTRERKWLAAEEERERSRACMEARIERQNEIAAFLRKNCWEPMAVHAQTVRAIFGNTHVDNYPLLITTQELENEARWTKYVADLAAEYIEMDKCCSRTPGLDPTETTGSSEPLQEAEPCWTEEDEISLIGTTTQRWVKRDQQHLTQLETHNHTLSARESILVQREIRKLKTRFNELFEGMASVKEREQSMVVKRAAGLRHVAGELLAMFQVTSSGKIPEDPTWHPTERPESIITVQESEVTAEPYSSPRELDTLKREAAVAERIRMFLSVDDFRRKALINMMDGVLEVRWEDEIKKDIPKPECLTAKDQVEHSEKAKEAIALYEDKVQKLAVERQKYRDLLERDFVKISGAMESGIREFNKRLEAFFIEKMNVDSAILQERLKLQLASRRDLQRTRSMERISHVKNNELIPTLRRSQELAEELSLLEEVVADVRNRYEALCKREKALENKFRGEYPDLKSPMVEHLLRHYRRRPRTGQLTCTAITYLTEIGKCVISGVKSEILPREYMEFLKGIDNLDAMPNNLPAQIDTNHWQQQCRLRRIKIEMEMRVKCCAVELAEAEQTVASYNRMISATQNRISHLKDVSRELWWTRQQLLEDAEVQLVLEMGQIEAHVRGRTDDLENALLVPTHELNIVNSTIVQAGCVKLAAMSSTVNFRRNILCKEWQHRHMCMILEDLTEEFKLLEGVKVTKEIQEYLDCGTARASKERDGEAPVKEINVVKQRFQRLADQENLSLERIVNQVHNWMNKNEKLNELIVALKIDNRANSLCIQNDALRREEKFTVDRQEALMQKTKLGRKVRETFNELLALQTALELLRLRTYPTLKFRTILQEETPNNRRDCHL